MKKICTYLIIFAMLVKQIGLCYAMENAPYEFTAFMVNRMHIPRDASVAGNIYMSPKIDESAVFYLLGDDAEVMEDTDDAKIAADDTSVYKKGNICIQEDDVTVKQGIAAANDINIDAVQIKSEGSNILYSDKDIFIEAESIDMKGVICAPNGVVKIKAKDVKIQGAIIADELIIHSDKTKIEPDLESEVFTRILNEYEKEGYMWIDAYCEDGKLGIYCEPNLDMANGDVFVRYDDADSFVNVGKIEGQEGWIDEFDFADKIDVIVCGYTKYGQIIESDIVSMEKLSTGEINYIERDSDNDKIADGIEIFYLGSDPYHADTDGDGENDGREAFYYCTDVNAYNRSFYDYMGDKIAACYNGELSEAELTDRKCGRFDKKVTIINDDGMIEKQVYDFINQKQKLQEKRGAVTAWVYDSEMNCVAELAVCGEESRIREYQYDDGNLTKVMNNGYAYHFSYDSDNRLTDVRLNDGNLLHYEYTDDILAVCYANGSRETEYFGSDAGFVEDGSDSSYTYVSDTESETVYYDNGLEIRCEYDENNSLSRLTANDGFAIEYTSCGDETMKYDTITYRFDGIEMTRENIVEYSEAGGRRLTSGLVTGDTYDKFYDKAGYENKILSVGDKQYNNRYKYDENNKITEVIYYDGTVEKYEYDSDSNLVSIEKDGAIINAYEYDAFERIIRETDYANEYMIEYRYDMYDNMLEKKSYRLNKEEAADVVSDITYGYSNAYKDQLVEINGKQIDYDENGKPVNYYNGFQYEWNGNKLVKACDDNNEISFSFDHNRMVIAKEINGTAATYNMEGKNYILENTEDGRYLYIYDVSSEAVGFVYDDKTYYYVKNALGDIKEIVDENYNFVCSYSYDAWGNITNISGNRQIADVNKYRYRGYYYDTVLGLYYLESRYYDSYTGRFISTDEIEAVVYCEDNLNMYAYCGNNPNKYIDPDGRVKVYIFTIEEFGYEGDYIAEDFKDYYGSSNVTVEVYKNDKVPDYVTKWNNLSYTEIVVFNTHGDWNKISDGKENFLKIAQLKSRLKNKNLCAVILLGCKNGNYNYSHTNVAKVFSEKISGCVVASDGYVKYNRKNMFGIRPMEFESVINTNERNIHGWLIYKYYTNRGALRIFVCDIYKITISSIMNIMLNNDFFRAFPTQTK